MILPILIADKDTCTTKRELNEWKRHNIDTAHVDSMQAAIEKLTNEQFAFVKINADNINYLQLLKVLRNTAPTLIFIFDSNYSKSKEIQAIRNGADMYTRLDADVELNVQLALAHLSRCQERETQRKEHLGIAIYEKFLVMSYARQIFYNDKPLTLTKKEYDILHYLIQNHDTTLSHSEIFTAVWKRPFDKLAYNSLWDYMLKLRKKLREVAGDREYIITERNCGYRFAVCPD